jgi:hypothetical protein
MYRGRQVVNVALKTEKKAKKIANKKETAK